jgi:predicted TIM-barrel fold metal-dependent hydrolase
VVLEEELHNTVDFIDRINERTVVIIPHMGGLNGGYAPLRDRGVFENPMVWADTALGAAYEIEDFANRYGVERILFGSDFPFGLPPIERQKVERIFSGSDLEAALKNNLLRLLGRWNED